MRKYYGMAEPKYMVLVLVLIIIFVGGGFAVYIYKQQTETPQFTAIGKYNDRKMSEPLDDKLIPTVSPTVQTKDELKSGSIIVDSDTGNTKTVGVFTNGSIKAD